MTRPARAARAPADPGEDAAVYVISVAAQLTGLHPQTLRTYERHGLLTPARTAGGGRRYSARDLARLADITRLTAAGIGIEGVRQILDLRARVAALEQDNRRLAAQLATARATTAHDPGERPRSRLPALRRPAAAVVVWRRAGS